MKLFSSFLIFVLLSGCTDFNNEYFLIETDKILISKQERKYEIEKRNIIKPGASICFITQNAVKLSKDLSIDQMIDIMNKSINHTKIIVKAISDKGEILSGGKAMPEWNLVGINDNKNELSACVALQKEIKDKTNKNLNSIMVSSTNEFHADGIYIRRK